MSEFSEILKEAMIGEDAADPRPTPEAVFAGVAYPQRVLTALSHNHRLGFTANPSHNLIGEMLDHQSDFLGDSVFVQIDEEFQQVGRLLTVVMGIVFDLLQQIPVRRIGRVVLQYIENVFLLDGLTHTVDAKGFKLSIRTSNTEQFQGLLFRCRRKGEDTHIRQMSTFPHLLDDTVFEIVTFVTLFSLGVFQAVGR